VLVILAYGQKVTPEFRGRVLRIAAHVGCDPSHLMACMYFESRLDPKSINPVSGASGLINFMPSTAIGLGATIEAIRAMTAIEQLELVEKYFAPYAGRLRTLADVYAAIFAPKAIGQADDFVLYASPSAAYVQNRALDINNDGKITKAEAASFPARRLAEGLQPGNATEERDPRATDAPQPTKGHTMADAVDTVAGIASIFNPAIGGAIGLAGQLFKSFSPMLQEKAAKEINRHTDDPAVGTKIAADLATMLLSQAKVLTGKSDDFEAVAAITQDPSQADNLAKLQTSLDAHLDKLMQAGDRSTQWDQALWAAQNVGRQTVSTIAIEERRAGLWDMTPTIVRLAGGTAAAMVLLITLAIVYQSLWGETGIDVGLIGLGGPLLMAAIQCWKDVFGYRFDGTKQSSDQSKALIQAATNGSKA
jgi:hypothetical protein